MGKLRRALATVTKGLLMDAETIYEIARYRNDTDPAELIDRVELVALPDGALMLRYADGHEKSCSGTDAYDIIAAEPDLHGVRTEEVTHIQATPAVLEQLPLLLRGRDDEDPEGVDDCPEEFEATVAGDWWSGQSTTDGTRILPTGDTFWTHDEPHFDEKWVEIRFIETASMTSGYFTGTLGLVTPAVVADFYNPDEDANQLTVFARGDDDAQAIADWFQDGAFCRDFCAAEDGHAMLTRLFAETALGREPSGTGDRLAAGVTQYVDSFGSSPSAEWSLTLSIDDEIAQSVLRRLGGLDARRADIIAGAVDPDSPPGQARAAALRELDDEDDPEN
jgi:hypothetical protein